jgi:hypothetical protein
VVLTWGALEWTIIDESWNMHRIILAQAFALAATEAFARGGGHSSHHYVSTIVGTIVILVLTWPIWLPLVLAFWLDRIDGGVEMMSRAHHADFVA